jgi:Skp family chaperone for outer membrane proteins
MVRLIFAASFAATLMSSAAISSAHAQSAPNMAPPNLGALSAQDAARLNQAVKASDPNTQQQFRALEDQLKKEGHPASRMLEATKDVKGR